MAFRLPARVGPIALALLLASGWVLWRAHTSVTDSGYRVGDRFLNPPESRHAAVEHLVLFVDSKCPFCAASVPFYKQLFGSGSSAPERSPVVVVGWEDVRRIEEFLSTNELKPAEVFSLGGRPQFRFRFTPTLLRVSSNGIVRDAWVGRLAREQELSVLRMAGTEH